MSNPACLGSKPYSKNSELQHASFLLSNLRMPRKKRANYNKAFYHVMMRGNYQQMIFYSTEDYEYFYQLLNSASLKYGCKIHLYCLMTNHVHLVIEVSQVPLWKVVQSIASRFSHYSNKKNARSGHLFQGRYLAKIVNSNEYLIELCYYIHSNPVSANMVVEHKDYLWSSHLSYLNKNTKPWLTTGFIQSILKRMLPKSTHPYSEFMNSKKKLKKETPSCDIDDDNLLTIKNSINARLHEKKNLYLAHLSIQQISQEICQHLDVDLETLNSPNQGGEITMTRSLIAYFSHYYGNYYLSEVALYFDRSADAVSKTLSRKMCSDKTKSAFKQHVHAIEIEFKKRLA